MTTAPVEGKVNAQGYGNIVGLALSGLIAWALGVLVWHQPGDAAHAMLAAAAVPPPVLTVLALLPVALGYACGYMAKHTPRPSDRPAIIQSGATTAPIDGPALRAVIDDLRAALAKPVKVTLDGQTVSAAPVFPTTDGTAPSDPAGWQMTETSANPTPEA